MKDLQLTDTSAKTDAEGCGCGCGDHASQDAATDTPVAKTCACGDDCTCGCNEGKPCACGDAAASCGCGPDCTCGCQDGKPCTCEGEPAASEGATPASGTTVTYRVTGMTCGHCVKAVTEEVSAIYGVTGVDVDLASGRLAITSEYPIDFDRVVEAVGEAGDYTVE